MTCVEYLTVYAKEMIQDSHTRKTNYETTRLGALNQILVQPSGMKRDLEIEFKNVAHDLINSIHIMKFQLKILDTKVPMSPLTW
jgi:hypothetical protein